MRRSASEVIRSLEARVARLEKSSASSPIDPRFNPRLASFLTKNSRFFEAEGASIYESEGYVNIHFNDNMPFKALEEIKDLIIRASYTTTYRAKWQVEAWNK